MHKQRTQSRLTMKQPCSQAQLFGRNRMHLEGSGRLTRFEAIAIAIYVSDMLFS